MKTTKVMLSTFLIAYTLGCVCNAQTAIRWCTISDVEQSKCRDMSTIFNDQIPDSAVTCVQKSSHLGCMLAISEGDADALTLDGGDILTAGKDYKMKPVIAEDYGSGDVNYWAVAVVKATSDVTFNNMKGKRSCHTGIGKTSGWNIPIGVLIEKEEIVVNDECNVPLAVGSFFEASCVPGAKSEAYDPNDDNPSNLCELCIGQEDAFCARSQLEPYYDYSGSFRCLAEDAGEVAFMKHTTVASYTGENTPPEWNLTISAGDFKLLCDDGSTVEDVNNYLGCNLASVPSHAVMTNGDKNNAYVKSVETLLLLAQIEFGSDENTNGFKMFDSSDYGGSDLIFKDSTVELVSIGDKDTYKKFLGEDYLNAIKAITCDNGVGLLGGSLTIVVVSVLVALFNLQ